MADPLYRTDIAALAEDLRRAHGTAARDVAVATAKEHLHAAAWKHGALWLQVVNRLTQAGLTQADAAQTVH